MSVDGVLFPFGFSSVGESTWESGEGFSVWGVSVLSVEGGASFWGFVSVGGVISS